MTKVEALARYGYNFIPPIHADTATLQNIDFQTTILSRFDMIFIVKDEHNEQRDKVRAVSSSEASVNNYLQMIARHVMNTQMNRPEENVDKAIGELSLDVMKRYIAYCKRYAAMSVD
jgi:DNA replication licensing factor MCM5